MTQKREPIQNVLRRKSGPLLKLMKQEPDVVQVKYVDPNTVVVFVRSVRAHESVLDVAYDNAPLYGIQILGWSKMFGAFHELHLKISLAVEERP